MPLESQGPQTKVSQDYFFFTKLTGNGRITVPASLRTYLNLNEGDWVRAYVYPKAPPSGFVPEDTDLGMDDPVVRAKQMRHIDN